MASGRAGGRRVWTGLDQGPRLRRRAVTSPPPSPGRCGPVARLGRWRPAGPGGTGPSCRVPSVSNPLNPPGLLQSIPPTACQPQGPDCVRACRLGVAASADPVNGPPAAGSRLSLVSSRQRPASRRAPTGSPAADPEHCFSWPRRRPASCRGARPRPGPPARVQPLPDSPSARGPQGHARDRACQLWPRQSVSARRSCQPTEPSAASESGGASAADTELPRGGH